MQRAIGLVAALFVMACASQPPLETNVSDDQLVTLVQQALDREPKLVQTKILVSAMNGTVELSGWARNDQERELAGRVARNVEGVRAVINNIHI